MRVSGSARLVLNGLSLVVGIDAQTAALAIDLRRQRKMTLGDALIAATCLEHGLKLATRNTSDFDWIAGLTVDALSDFAV